ncbi:MAG: hypothetical protein ACYCZE_09005 [Thiobacillus sp.]
MANRSYLRLFLLIPMVIAMSGCLESSFDLAPGSRLPKWFEIPKGMTRNELSVTMDYYIDSHGRKAVFKIYAKGRLFPLKKVTGIQRGLYPIELENQPPGFPKGYPSYEVITVNGITDIIEHRKMEAIFYTTDDPRVWKELGVEQGKAVRPN